MDAKMSDAMKPNFLEQDEKRQGIEEQNLPLAGHITVSFLQTTTCKTYF